MNGILDIAAGVIIGAAILGVIYSGLMGMVHQSPTHKDNSFVNSLGFLVFALGMAAAFWLIFVRTGIVGL